MDDDKKLDLDSLDQLLEDAELAQLTGGVMDTPATPVTAPAKPAAATQSVADAPKPTSPPTEAVAVAEASRSEPPKLAAERPVPPSQDKKKATTDSTQDAWTEQEMDGIKKLIMIFGSSIVVLSLTAVGIAIGGLFKSAKTAPEVISALEETKSGLEETYKLAEGNNREIKELGLRMTEMLTQLSDTEAVMNDIKAIHEEQLQHVANAQTAAPAKKVVAEAPASVEIAPVMKMTSSNAMSGGQNTGGASLGANDPQVMSLSADMKDIKRRLAVAHKALESLQKQSNGIQEQSAQLMDVVRSVETELKSRKATKAVAPAPKPATARTSKATEENPSTSYRDEQTYRAAPVKPVDDAAARMRWQQQMDKTDSFP